MSDRNGKNFQPRSSKAFTFGDRKSGGGGSGPRKPGGERFGVESDGASMKMFMAVAVVLLGLLFGGAIIALGVSTSSVAVSASLMYGSLPDAHTPTSRAIGREDAPVKIVIYGDFQCSHCRDLHNGIEAELIRQYVATGKARLELRQMPLLGDDSVRAAEAALSAADQGRFFEYREALYAAWTTNGRSAYSADNLRVIAQRVGLDMKAFDSSVAAGTHKAEVEAELSEGKAKGVTGVPAIFINDTRVYAVDPLSRYVEVIEGELAK